MTVALLDLYDLHLRDNLLALAGPGDGHGDGHVLTVTVALLLAILSGRADLCIAGVFGAGKTRSLAVKACAIRTLTRSHRKGKGEAYATRIDVRCDRNRIISSKACCQSTSLPTPKMADSPFLKALGTSTNRTAPAQTGELPKGQLKNGNGLRKQSCGNLEQNARRQNGSHQARWRNAHCHRTR